jgi:hypothetical protein
MACKRQGIEIMSGWQAGSGGEDSSRELVQRSVQYVLEAEMTSFLVPRPTSATMCGGVGATATGRAP